MRLAWVGATVAKYDPDAQAHFDIMTSTSVPLMTAINDFVIGLKADGIWSKTIVINLAHDNEADSRLNIRGTAVGNNSVKVGNPTFTANRGYNMSTNNIVYMNESAASKLLDDSFHLWMYNRVDVLDGTNAIAVSTGINGSNPFTLNIERTYGFDTVITTTGLANGGQSLLQTDIPVTGFIGYGTTLQDSALVHNNAFVNAASAWGSAVNDNTDPYGIGGELTGTTAWTVPADLAPAQYSGFGMGYALTLQELQNYRLRVQSYMTAIGAQV